MTDSARLAQREGGVVSAAMTSYQAECSGRDFWNGDRIELEQKPLVLLPHGIYASRQIDISHRPLSFLASVFLASSSAIIASTS